MTAAENLDPDESMWNLIAIYLREERVRRGLSQSNVAKIIKADRARVANLEAGRLRLNEDQAKALDTTWHNTHFASMRRYAIKLDLGQDWDKQLADLEDGALVVRIYLHGLIPVPLQTEAYASWLLTAGRVVRDIADAVAKRMTRTSKLLGQLPGMDLWVLVDERALTPPGVDPAVMREQLYHLLELAMRPGVCVRIVPEEQSVHVGTDGSFEVIVTARGDYVAYVWAQLSGRLVHEGPDVRDLSLRYDRIGSKARPEKESLQLIQAKADQYDRVAKE
ncbi:helix-turn-helix domain-containing protein [Actinomadura oligospora]|uniref:helix-turn-helix domain-containing protein n=1 Tax=Actinomadura oligospora TaxID=111804 RepID=UPI00047D8FEA|nr:helix-turn-helix transcriptional regulator [Actinomadura oligospora]